MLIQKISPKASLGKAQTGWSLTDELCGTDHPVRSFLKVASLHFLEVASTPPVPGGDFCHVFDCSSSSSHGLDH